MQGTTPRPETSDPFATPTLSPPASIRTTTSHRQRRILGRSAFTSQIESVSQLKIELDRRSWLCSQPAEVGSEHQRTIGVISRSKDDGTDSFYYVAEPDNVHSDLAEACELLASSYAFTMSSPTTGQLFSVWNVDDLSFAATPPYPILSQLAELTDEASQLSSAVAYICPIQRIVYVFGPSATELVWNAVAVEVNLLRFIHSISGTDPQQQLQASMSEKVLLQSLPYYSTTPQQARTPYSGRTSMKSSQAGSESGMLDHEKKKDQITTIIELEEAAKEAAGAFDSSDEEAMKVPSRKQPLWHSIRMSAVALLVCLVLTIGAGKVYREWAIGGSAAYPRMAFAAGLPLFAFFSIFFFCVIVGCIFFVIGPIADIVGGNNKYYSGVKPRIERHRATVLPHVTVQMPVYKEGLQAVIKPTVDSVMTAIQRYEAHGGTANFFVAEDGMQAIADDLALARQKYYEYMGLGWCARPKHEYSRKNKTGFNRRGKFKKASNLNYCLDFALRVETTLEAMLNEQCSQRGCQIDDVSEADQQGAYDRALADELAKDEGHTWASGDIRIGEVILLIDSDTRVPEDCLLYGALEMEESPDVAIIQHSSGVMQVINNTFENAITYFTNLIYLSIKAGVGLGDMAPFVGHNAFIRWKAVQDVAFKDRDDNNIRKFWTDNNVSEDFDLALRLETVGYAVRYATYHGGEFKEGVSLTVFDELLRWEKYAYGTSEMIFNPLYQWMYRGPFSPLILRFIFTTRIPGASKLSILAYLGTYFALGCAFPLTIANYFLVGWFSGRMPLGYLPSWNNMIAILVIFNIVNPVCYAWYRQRVRDERFFKALWQHFKWTPVFLVFFNGLSFHIMKALICHLFSLPIEWSATEKEIGPQGLMVNLDRIMKQFKYVFMVCTALLGGVVYLGIYAPRGWEINNFTVIVPLALQIAGHILLPIVFAVIN